MENQKLLSIVIPTYNRGYILPFTLSLWKEQVERHLDEVEFIICNNASTDDTADVLLKLQKESPFFKIINYTDHVDVGVSIFRSMTDNAKGVYVLNWGDDDVPAPMLLDIILSKLRSHPEICALLYNRLEGDSDDKSFDIHNLFVSENVFSLSEKYYENSKSLAEEHYREMGFLSITVIKTKEVLLNKQYYSSENIGYEFLAPMLCAMKGKSAIYIDFPLCIQRHAYGKNGKNVWIERWPLYAYIGNPRTLQYLQKLDVIDDWRKVFNSQKFQKTDEAYYATIYNSMLPYKEIYKPYLSEMLSYQTDAKRIRKTKQLLSNNIISNISLFFWKCQQRGLKYIFSLPQRMYNHIRNKKVSQE